MCDNCDRLRRDYDKLDRRYKQVTMYHRDEMRMKLWCDVYTQGLRVFGCDAHARAQVAVHFFDQEFPKPKPEILPQAVG